MKLSLKFQIKSHLQSIGRAWPFSKEDKWENIHCYFLSYLLLLTLLIWVHLDVIWHHQEKSFLKIKFDLPVSARVNPIKQRIQLSNITKYFDSPQKCFKHSGQLTMCCCLFILVEWVHLEMWDLFFRKVNHFDVRELNLSH